MFRQGYSRYLLRETLHLGADFPGFGNNDGVGAARRPDRRNERSLGRCVLAIGR
jgi:hypothetical protein